LTQDPRRDLSVPLPIRVERRDGSERDEYAVNLSSSGLCLHAREPLEIGEELRVAFQLPRDRREIRAICKVVWKHEGDVGSCVPRFYETGLFLVEVASADAERIAWYVSEQVDRR
jgi:hypothetical protein